QRANQDARWMIEGHRRARDLPECVHPGVRAPRAVYRNRRALEFRERVLEQALYRFSLGLPLPADEPGAVVGDGELESTHQGTVKPQRRGNSGREWYFYASLSLCGESQAREPGLMTGFPSAHSGHFSAS